MSDKLSLKGLIDTELHDIWGEYLSYADSKISCSKDIYENDISTSGYVKDNFTYYVLVDHEEYIIVKPSGDSSSLSIAIENIKNNYNEEGIDINAIDTDLLTSSDWELGGGRVFLFDNREHTWFGKLII